MTDRFAPDDTRQGSSRSAAALPRWLVTACRALIVLALPPFLALTGVRLVMSEAFLDLEYNRSGFPPDRYGFTQADRLRYAPYAVQYLLDNEETGYLAALEHEGMPLFTPKELQHMQDVQVVTRIAFRVHRLITVLLLLAIAALGWERDTRRTLRQGLFEGSILTLLLILTLVVLVVANWDFFFTSFHQLFFEGDSWLFSTRSTLIRLFPERFWVDAALAVGGLTFVGALAAILVARLWDRRARIAVRSAGLLH